MDVKAYIESGILEEYNLGTLSDQETREVECMAKIYPEIKQALINIEENLEQFAAAYAKKPPAGTRENILSAISQTEQDEKKIIPIQKPEHHQQSLSANKSMTWLAAAAILGFAFGVWQFYLNQNQKVTIAGLELQNNQMQQEYESLEMQLAEMNRDMDEMYNPMLEKVVMDPVMEGYDTKVSVFWNKENGQITLDPSDLPELASDEQYQMWVIRDGTPVDMGIIPKNPEGALMASKKTMKGEAFTLTIEPLGGKPTPNLDKLVVIGYTA